MAGPETIEVPVNVDLKFPVGIYAALAAAAGEIGAIPKDKQNTAQNFAYRSIESIVAAAKTVFEKYGISVVPSGHEVISSEQVESSHGSRGYRVVVSGRWRVGQIDGSYIDASMLGESIDYGDKATSKAVQMAYKYLLTQMLGIGSEDPDGESPDAGVETSQPDPPPLHTNALKASLLEEADGDTAAAESLWDEILDHLGYSEPLEQSQLKKVELVIREKPEEES